MIQNATKIQVEERAMHVETVTTASTFTVIITLAMLHYGIYCVYIYNLLFFYLELTHTHTNTNKHTQNPHTNTHTNTHKNTHKHKQTHTKTHTQTHTHKNTQTQKHTHTNTQTQAHTHTHTHTNTHKPTHTNTHIVSSFILRVCLKSESKINGREQLGSFGKRYY
jgi:sensor c-di-GMP phosphodiesterase-like protein